MLADLTAATDPKLRELARRLAGRLFLDVSPARARPDRGASARCVEQPYRPDAGDLDIDASIEAIVEAGGGRSAVDPERLRVRGWVQPGTALCLLVDRSGSMGGKPLATVGRRRGRRGVALAATTTAWSPSARTSIVAKSQDGREVGRAGRRTTCWRCAASAPPTWRRRCSAPAEQLSRSRAGRKMAILLSDCRSTVDGDPVAAAAMLDELVIVAPEGDSDEAAAFAARVGARLATASGPSSVAEALAQVLG